MKKLMACLVTACAVVACGGGGDAVVSQVTATALAGQGIGAAQASNDGQVWTLSNAVLAAEFECRDGNCYLRRITNKLAAEHIGAVHQNLFTLHLADRSLSSSQMRLRDRPQTVVLDPAPDAARLADRFRGQAIELVFEDSQTGLTVTWQAVLRDESNYLRQQVSVTSSSHRRVLSIDMIDARAPAATLAGYTDGAPVMAGNWFMGLEHPLSRTTIATDGDTPHIVASLPRHVDLSPGQTWVVASAIGVATEGQLRRAFSHYLERERAHPYRQYWHYNSWFDLNIGRNGDPDPLRRMTEPQALDVIQAFEQSLFQAHGVPLDGFVWDDGWDNWRSLWQFHEGFPNGFSNVSAAARRQGADVGAWLSPWGGYGEAQAMRLAYGAAHGYEADAQGFSLGGATYYDAFRNTCLSLIRDQGLGYFKFDGIGLGTLSTGASDATASAIENLLRLMSDLRSARPDIFVNATVGTWASPYWLMYADSIWRQGADVDFSGKGNPRERWINYRDTVVYDRFISKSPLFPVNGLMYHGLVVGPTFGPGSMPTPAENIVSFRNELRMMAGYASGLGELYVSPALMTTEAWSELASTIRWSRSKRNIVRDAHWIGGNPGEHQVYGFAAWHPTEGGVMTLRNPDDTRRDFRIDGVAAFELPTTTSRSFVLNSPYRDQRVQTVRIAPDQPVVVTMEPFEVLVFETR